MMGLGDVASILIPAIKIIQGRYPEAKIDVLTFGPACELIENIEGINALLRVEKEQWPSPIMEGIDSFQTIGSVVTSQEYDKIINYDTWFMVCYLARYLLDHGEPVEGNYINISSSHLLTGLRNGTITQSYVDQPSQYIESTFENMADWHIPYWWDKHATSYPLSLVSQR